MKNKISQKSKKKAGFWFWLWCFAAITTGAIIGVLYLFFYSPRAYQPTKPEHPEQVSLYLTHELGPEFVNQVQLDKPFELIIEQAGLNDIISRLDWPQQFGDMSFADPVVYFLDQSILLMGTLKYKEINSVVSLTTFPTMNDDGQICLNIESIRLGMVPVTTLIAKLSQKAFDDNLDCFEGEPEAQAITQAIIRNEYFDPVFHVPDYRVRITEFSIESGLLKLILSPKQDQ